MALRIPAGFTIVRDSEFKWTHPFDSDYLTITDKSHRFLFHLQITAELRNDRERENAIIKAVEKWLDNR